MDRLMIVKDMVMSEKKLLRLWPEYTIDLASHLVIPVVNITRHLRLFDSVASYLETMLENRGLSGSEMITLVFTPSHPISRKFV